MCEVNKGMPLPVLTKSPHEPRGESMLEGVPSLPNVFDDELSNSTKQGNVMDSCRMEQRSAGPAVLKYYHRISSFLILNL